MQRGLATSRPAQAKGKPFAPPRPLGRGPEDRAPIDNKLKTFEQYVTSHSAIPKNYGERMGTDPSESYLSLKDDFGHGSGSGSSCGMTALPSSSTARAGQDWNKQRQAAMEAEERRGRITTASGGVGGGGSLNTIADIDSQVVQRREQEAEEREFRRQKRKAEEMDKVRKPIVGSNATASQESFKETSASTDTFYQTHPPKKIGSGLKDHKGRKEIARREHTQIARQRKKTVQRLDGDSEESASSDEGVCIESLNGSRKKKSFIANLRTPSANKDQPPLRHKSKGASSSSSTRLPGEDFRPVTEVYSSPEKHAEAEYDLEAEIERQLVEGEEAKRSKKKAAKRAAREDSLAIEMDSDEDDAMIAAAMLHDRRQASPDALLDALEDEGVDPDTLCPFCDEPLPETPSPRLLSLRDRLLSRPDAVSMPNVFNAKRVKLDITVTASFCSRHVDETKTIPEGKSMGWPTSIDWVDVRKRIDRNLSQHLMDIIQGRKPSVFLDMARHEWETRGSFKMRNIMSEIESFEVEQPGYYGSRGFEVINQKVFELVVEEQPALTALNAKPLDVRAYIRRVLVPECAVELIKEDQGCSREEAEFLRSESRAYGKAQFSNPTQEEESFIKEEEAREGRRLQKRAAARAKKVERRKNELLVRQGGEAKVAKAREFYVEEDDLTTATPQSSRKPNPPAVSQHSQQQNKTRETKESSDSDEDHDVPPTRSIANGGGKNYLALNMDSDSYSEIQSSSISGAASPVDRKRTEISASGQARERAKQNGNRQSHSGKTLLGFGPNQVSPVHKTKKRPRSPKRYREDSGGGKSSESKLSDRESPEKGGAKKRRREDHKKGFKGKAPTPLHTSKRAFQISDVSDSE